MGRPARALASSGPARPRPTRLDAERVVEGHDVGARSRLEAAAIREAEQVGRRRGRGAHGIGQLHVGVADDVAHGLVHGERAAGQRAVAEARGTAVEVHGDLADGGGPPGDRIGDQRDAPRLWL